MTSESNRISAASTAYVETVCRAWAWSWNEIKQTDDDGLDGLVYIRTMEVNNSKPTDRRSWKHLFTGGLIHVQVKSGASYIVNRTNNQLEISVSNLDVKKDFWMKSPLPVALIYVQEEPIGRSPSRAWWADLKLPATYSTNGNIIVPLKNRFQPGIECRRPFSRLASGQHRRLGLNTVDMSVSSQLPGKLDQMSKGLKAAAIDFYKQWKLVGTTNPDIGDIIVNRTGWAHMTRVGRPISRIQASFELLPAAARIITTVKSWQVLKRGATIRNFDDGSWAVYDYLGLSAIVKWHARAPSEVMVILRRQTIFAADSIPGNSMERVRHVDRKIWFYSVYEPGRRKNAI
ncbi:DUF4365 domain-containing protein [Candidatus Methylomicrobium oryzae]|uniref:DUF4365 domain-containing protein n=1 Tax=Candidatus Methylomicrobium oryzae TaxID=2802053 RepID=UPI0019217A0C|nr:DUF4365 domain-containing protein [Methylomicrobium sp. RS1]MBL1265839.1 DUF4365 domain-containing protein [Methylomicrobium sp. RS1]